VVGEASGDLHASHLMQAIKNLDSSSRFCGVGGEKMELLSFQSLVSIEKLAVIGFFEVIKQLPFFLRLKTRVLEDIKQQNPDKIILVDYPGFNLRLARSIKKELGIPVIYYISPQLWAWKEKRISIIKKYVDSMIVLFPFEKSWYAKRGLLVHYFGHPFAETYNKFLETFRFTKKAGVDTVALFPGSRQQELHKHLPLYKKIIKELKNYNPNLFFVLKFAEGSCIDVYKELGLKDNYLLERGESFGAFAQSDFAIVASGTATLEGAFAKTPMAVIYKTSWLSWFLAKYFLNISFISIVNILNKTKLVEEFLQTRAKPKVIAKYVIENLNSHSKINYMPVLDSLTQKNVYQNTAKHIIAFKL